MCINFIALWELAHNSDKRRYHKAKPVFLYNCERAVVCTAFRGRTFEVVE